MSVRTGGGSDQDGFSCGYRHILNKKLEGAVMVDSFGTSKSADNPNFLASLRLFISQMNRCDMIIFNNGLHGWHLSDENYKASCKKLIESLRAEYPSKKWAIAFSTPLRDSKDLSKFVERNDIVKQRNLALKDIADELDIPVLDFFSAICENAELWSIDGVHLTPDGYSILSDICCEQIKKDLL